MLQYNRFYRRLFFRDRYFRDQVFVIQRIFECPAQAVIDPLAVLESEFHFCRMYIHIQKLAIHLEVQHRKRILMQHHKVFVRILNTF